MSDSDVLEFDCRRARQTVHEILDGDGPAADGTGWLDEHLTVCESCRGFDADMRALQASLQGLPALRLPDSVLDQVRRVTMGEPDRPQAKRWRIEWRSFAAAAVLTAAAFGLWQWNGREDLEEPPSTVGMIVIDPARLERDPEYARHIAEETRRVLGLTSQALRQTERAAVRGVLVDQIAGALEKVPVEWPDEDELTKKNRDRENEL
jgi:predicted anti-sigma-YlaC factor YlaD